MNSRNDTEFDEDVMFVDMPSDGGADPLALFESEADPDQAGGPAPLESKDASPAASLTRVRRPMALDQVLHRLGSVSWAEAVAIVEGLCQVLISGNRERVPEMSRIAITAAGGVAVGTGGVNDAAGPILARMLHTLAATGSIPAPLRLLVTKWTSAGDWHPIAEFAKELGYFARPDGQNLIQGVYERAVASVPVRPTPRQEVPRPKPPVRPPQTRDSRFLYFVVAAVALLVVSLTALVALRGTGSSSRASSTPGSTATAPSDDLAAGTNPPSAAAPGRQRGSETRAAAATSGVADRGTTPVVPFSPRGNAPGAPPAPVSSAVRATLASPAAASPRSAPTPPSSLFTPSTKPPSSNPNWHCSGRTSAIATT